MKTFPARLHVLLAREAPVGLVIRRGPSKQVATFLWDRTNDTFELGQWLKGRIYERRCDLSPDGTYFIYFAINGKWGGDALGSWTAISVAPYLKAISLFQLGHTYNGGGLWVTSRTYWLNGDHKRLRESPVVRRDERYKPTPLGKKGCLGAHHPQLLRDGWKHTEDRELGKWNSLAIFEKPAGHDWILRKLAHYQGRSPVGKGCYWDEHELFNSKTNTVIKCPTWEWAELDGDRLVWAEGGVLKAAKVGPDGPESIVSLRDFNEDKFQEIVAPY